MGSLNRLADPLERLARVATITREYKGDDVTTATRPLVDQLIATYPALSQCGDYLDFLRTGGGAHVSNQIFSLGIYGFEGYVVASLEERALLDQDQFFLFGEFLMLNAADEEKFLFFDIRKSRTPVFWRTADQPSYRPCSACFIELLISFADGTFCDIRDGRS